LLAYRPESIFISGTVGIRRHLGFITRSAQTNLPLFPVSVVEIPLPLDSARRYAMRFARAAAVA
jgi:hypothetical protein